MLVRVLLLALFCLAVHANAADDDLTDTEIRTILIKQSQAGYSGRCPCPYSVNRAGRQCGHSSAYSKPGGRAPLCYPDDVTKEAIAAFRAAKDLDR